MTRRGFMTAAGTVGAAICALTIRRGRTFAAESVGVKVADTRVHVSVTGRPQFVYRYGDVPYKPYVERLYTPAGINVLRDGAPDHPHHHGLMFGVKVGGLDFWGEEAHPGRQRHVRFDAAGREMRGGPAIAEEIAWEDPADGAMLLKERRTLATPAKPDREVTFLSWTSTFEPPDGKGPVEITGSHYHGLGMRFVASMDGDCRFRNAEGNAGDVFRGQEELTVATWCAITGKADGKPVTVTMFGHPDNPRPTTWFTMPEPFAYLSATGRYHEEPLVVEEGKPVTLRYGVALWDGAADDAAITTAYEKWARESS